MFFRPNSPKFGFALRFRIGTAMDCRSTPQASRERGIGYECAIVRLPPSAPVQALARLGPQRADAGLLFSNCPCTTTENSGGAPATSSRRVQADKLRIMINHSLHCPNCGETGYLAASASLAAHPDALFGAICPFCGHCLDRDEVVEALTEIERVQSARAKRR